MSEKTAADFFDEWARDGDDAGLEEEHGDVVRQVIEQMSIDPGEKILDLGCGNGWATRQLAQTNAGVQAIGLDVSPGMIARADELTSYTIRARFDLGRFEELDFEDGEFSRIFSMEALYYAVDLDAAVREIHRVLKAGGCADVIVDFYREHPLSALWNEKLEIEKHLLGEGEWKALFEREGFTNVGTSRVIDSRGPGDEAACDTDGAWHPDWPSRVQSHEAGSLWIHAEKPG